MIYRKLLLACIVIVGLNNCGGNSTNEIDTEETANPVTVTQPSEQSTTVNNEAVSFPQSTNKTSNPTDQLPKN